MAVQPLQLDGYHLLIDKSVEATVHNFSLPQSSLKVKIRVFKSFQNISRAFFRVITNPSVIEETLLR
jgi:hypothetical protein